MSKELSGIVSSQPVPAPKNLQAELRSDQARPQALSPEQTVVKSERIHSRDAIETAQSLEQVAEQAARKMFPERDVKVEGFMDEQSGRFVFRVADKQSGQIIHQSPPDELLRFFASAREPDTGPMVHVDA